LKFVKDDVRNIEKYGAFDVLFVVACSITWIFLFLFKSIRKINIKNADINTHYAKLHDLRYDSSAWDIAL